MNGQSVYCFKDHPILCKTLSDTYGVEVIAVDSTVVKHGEIDIPIQLIYHIFTAKDAPATWLTNIIVLDIFKTVGMINFFPKATHIFLLDFIHVDAATTALGVLDVYGLRIGNYTKKTPKIIRVPTL